MSGLDAAKLSGSGNFLYIRVPFQGFLKGICKGFYKVLYPNFPLRKKTQISTIKGHKGSFKGLLGWSWLRKVSSGLWGFREGFGGSGFRASGVQALWVLVLV